MNPKSAMRAVLLIAAALAFGGFGCAASPVAARAADGSDIGGVGVATADGAIDATIGDTADEAGTGALGAAVGDADIARDLVLDTAPRQVCPPKLVGCTGNQRLVCNDRGTAFTVAPCAKDKVCVQGQCLACATDGDCPPGYRCTSHTCAVPPLAVATRNIPPMLQNTSYLVQLNATGGIPPYTWKLGQGPLPTGMKLAASGTLSGTTSVVGSYPFRPTVTDDQGTEASGALTLDVEGGGLHITTTSPLRAATEGTPYTTKLAAIGGSSPYFWGLASGQLPAGLLLAADGTIFGTPTTDGSFDFTVKCFDSSPAPLVATQKLELPVKIAPLRIVGKQTVNLYVTKLIVLPLIIVVNGIPIPYSAHLEATGGRKPYHWAESKMPSIVTSFIPHAGLPAGLKLAADGTLSGAVTDPSLAVNVAVPFTQIKLTGFFFAAKVKDSQAVPDSASALFIIPTAPIGGN